MCEEEIYNQTTIKQYAQRTLLNLQIDAKIRQICHFRHDKKLKLESFLKMSTRTSVIIQVKLVPLPQLNWFSILKRSCLGVIYPVWVYDFLYDRPEKLKFLSDNPTKAEKQHMWVYYVQYFEPEIAGPKAVG